MTDSFVADFESIRSFFTPRIEEETKILSKQLSDVQDDTVREFFAQHEFCQRWLAELSVAGWARIALNCEAITLEEIEENYTLTEYGPYLIAEKMFCFAITCDGGIWVVSIDDGRIHKIDGTATEHLYIEKSWENFRCFMAEIELNNLRE